jgi:hypothetical protein
MVKKSNSPQDKNKLLIFVAIWLVIILSLAYQFLIPGECPDHYTQAQVDETGCTIGANIGLGIVLLFIWPVLVVVFALIVLAAYRRFIKPKPSNRPND